MAERYEVTRSEYFRELGVLSGKIRRRNRLRSEYFSLMRSIRPLMAERRRLEARRIRYPPIPITERAYINRRLKEIAEERERRLSRMRDIREVLAELEASIERERIEIRKKIVPPPPPPPPRLHRVKIRIYNEWRSTKTPAGMFQGWFDIDVLIDPETGLIDWDWWLTVLEIDIARYHFVGYWKGQPISVDRTLYAYMDQPDGIPYADMTVSYKRPRKEGAAPGAYAPNIPAEFIAQAEKMTVGELIIGESTVEPEPVDATQPIDILREIMGVFFEKVMIIDADGLIKWHQIRNKWVWHPTDDQIERVKSELT